MNDLRFMIVNSNLLHSQNLIHELKSRVSFDVYQDTEEKNIWGLMQGGKDDLYVYDRCGRLAYYIPFPLSIMSSEESSLVTSAILATYYRSPCGTTCERNSPTLEDFLNNANSTGSPVETTTENIPSTTEAYRTIFSSNKSADSSDSLQTNISSNFYSSEMKGNNSEVIGDFDYQTHNNTLMLDNFDYPMYDETLEDQNSNETHSMPNNALLNTLYSLFFNAATTEPPTTENANETFASNSSLGMSKRNEINVPLNLSDPDIIRYNSNITEMPSEIETQTPKPKADRCAEADSSVCKDWSKKRLLRAYNCCALIEDESPHQPQFCKNFGKKRCKKMRTILKCCIKTALFEVTTETAVSTKVIEEEVTAAAVAAPVTEVKYDIVCCRDVQEGKLCRVSEDPTCELGEYVEESRTPTQDVPLLGKTM